MTECKICTFCDEVIDPDEMGWIEIEEFGPVGLGYEPEMFIFHHYKCLKLWLGLA